MNVVVEQADVTVQAGDSGQSKEKMKATNHTERPVGLFQIRRSALFTVILHHKNQFDSGNKKLKKRITLSPRKELKID